MKVPTLSLIAFLVSISFLTSAGAQTRAFGAHEFVLDDGLGHTLTLQTSTMGTNQTFTFPAVTSYTPGSVLFADGAGAINQNNAVFFWDNTHNRLGIGNAIPAYPLDVTGAINTSTVYSIGGSAVLSDAGIDNLFAGVGAGAVNTVSGNTFVGRDAGHSNTTGASNTATGWRSLDGNTTGSDNTAFGVQSLGSNTTGANNTATGDDALGSNTTGIDNTASGEGTLFFNNTGSDNTASGLGALTDNTSGSDNTASGYFALHSNISGDHLTAIGDGADVSVDGLTNSTALGAGASVGTSNTIQLGSTGVTLVNTSGGVQFGLALLPNGLAGTTGQVLTSQGAGVAPVWAAASLSHIMENYNNSVAPYSAGSSGEQLLATDAAATNISIALQPKGNGALEAQIADNGTTGGNARGWNAVDWQTLRFANTEVASGNYSTVSGGWSNVASGSSATVSGGTSNSASSYATVSGGASNTASGNYAMISGGLDAHAFQYGQHAQASGEFAAQGDAQTSVFTERISTTDATPINLALDGGTTYLSIPTNTTWTYHILVSARDDQGGTATSDGWVLRGFVSNNNGTLTTPTGGVGSHYGASGWSVVLITSGTSLIIQVTGAASTNIRWVARVETAEVGY